ncbi:CDP-diacylglycerol synthase [Citrus sinensis]|uniref:CDP-diacylglycerol synthase n=1 Tax=Citrus sinensis TaxID=2711 RepID=A0ACB8NBU3_CITSI|nr:CDP-diacylglycerol synthase [Citrus sinensis]
MENDKKAELASFLKVIPPVEFCCVYGSSLHPNNKDKSAMVDYVLGVSDPQQWHSEVQILADNLDIGNANSVNLRSALSAALLLLPSKFTQEDLFAKVCSLSYMGDLRMLFAEDKNKVKKIVQGQFDLFKSMYNPLIQEYEAKEFLRFSSYGNHQANVSQDCGVSVTFSLVSSLPPTIKSEMGMKLGENKTVNESGRVVSEVIVRSRDKAAKCLQNVLRRKVMISSARQAVSGLLAAGGVNAARYLGKKMEKAWKSWR